MIEPPQPTPTPNGAASPTVADDGQRAGAPPGLDDPLLLLARVDDVLAESLDLDGTLKRLGQLLLASLADACSVHLLDDDGGFRRVEVGSSNPQAEELAASLGSHAVDQGRAGELLQQALVGGQARLHAPVTTAGVGQMIGADAAQLLLRDLPVTSAMVVPLVARRQPVGVIGLATVERPPFSEASRRLVEEIGHRAAVAVAHARLYQAATASQRAAEAGRARASFLAEASAALSSSLDVPTTLRTVVRLAVPRMADACSIALADPDGTLRRVAIAHADPERQQFIDGHSDIVPMDPDGRHPADIVMATGEPFVDNAVTPDTVAQYATGAYYDLLRGLSIRAKMVVPLEARGRRIGVVMLATSDAHRAFDDDDVTLWSDLALRAALAIDNARLYQEACEAKHRLTEQRHLSQVIVDTMEEGILVADRDGVLTYVNPSVERILGWTPEQLLGRHSHGILHARDPAGTPFPRAECPVAGIFTTHQRVQLNDAYFIRADGVVIPVVLTASPLVQDGRVIGGITVFRDVSGARRQREELRRSEELLRRALSSTGMVLWERDFASGRTYRTANATALYGRPITELVDDPLHFRRLIHPDDYDEVLAEGNAAIARGDGYDIEFRSLWPDGSVRWLCGRASVLTDEHGIPTGLTGTAHDITDRKVAQLAVERLLDERQAEAEELRKVQQRLQRSLAALLGLHDVGKLLNSVEDLNATGRRLLEIALRAATLKSVALHHRNRSGPLRLWRRAGSTPETRAAWNSSAVADARRCTLASGKPSIRTVTAVVDVPALTAWCLPLLVKGEVIGVLEALGEPRAADELTEDILGSIALQAATALENVRLYREVADSERALRRLVHQLMTTQEVERRRLANDIHDGFAQLALGVQQVVEAYAHRFPGETEAARRQMEVAISLAGRTVSEIRRVLAGLRPSILEDFGLVRALQALAVGLDMSGLTVAYEGRVGPLRLTDDVELALFRVAQEALTNVQKHAGVSHADLRLRRSGSDVVLEIQDNGHGFDPATAADGGPGEHLGLVSMAERITQVGGTFKVESKRGRGTLVRAVVPVARDGKRHGRRRADR